MMIGNAEFAYIRDRIARLFLLYGGLVLLIFVVVVWVFELQVLCLLFVVLPTQIHFAFPSTI